MEMDEAVWESSKLCQMGGHLLSISVIERGMGRHDASKKAVLGLSWRSRGEHDEQFANSVVSEQSKKRMIPLSLKRALLRWY